MKKKIRPKNIIIPIIVIILLLISLFPLYYMLVQSLVPWEQVDKTLFSTDLSLRSYKYLFGTGGDNNSLMWLRALLNSFIVSTATALISIVVGLFLGYAMTQIDFKGKKFIYNLILFQMFFPVIILLVPRFIMMKRFSNSYFGMILPICISTWAIFMYLNYFKTLPDDIFEAARIDGASNLQIIGHIALPLTRSITAIVFLSQFMGRWNELMWDMIIAPDIDMQTLNVLISTQFKPMGNYPGPLYAASVMLTAPIIILFLSFSNHFREGIDFMLK